jgi:hypothetical protein
MRELLNQILAYTGEVSTWTYGLAILALVVGYFAGGQRSAYLRKIAAYIGNVNVTTDKHPRDTGHGKKTVGV